MTRERVRMRLLNAALFVVALLQLPLVYIVATESKPIRASLGAALLRDESAREAWCRGKRPRVVFVREP